MEEVAELRAEIAELKAQVHQWKTLFHKADDELYGLKEKHRLLQIKCDALSDEYTKER